MSASIPLSQLLSAKISSTDACLSPVRTIVGYHDENLADLLKKMIDGKIQAIPVVDAYSKAPICIVRMLDIIACVVERISRETVKRMEKHTFDFLDVVMSRREIDNYSALSVSDLHPAVSISPSETLLNAISVMVEKNIQRVWVTEGRALANVVSASRVLKHLASAISTEPWAKRPLAEIIQKSDSVPTISNQAMTYDAFALMHKLKVLSIGVVDENQRLVGNISTSDIKLLGYELSFFDLLRLPVQDYLRELKNQRNPPIQPEAVLAQRGAISCLPTDTVADAVNLLVHNHIHSLYIVDDQQKPIATLGMNDIWKLIQKNSPQ